MKRNLFDSDFGSLKNPVLKLELVQISLESGPRSPGNPAVKFNNVIGHEGRLDPICKGLKYFRRMHLNNITGEKINEKL